MKEIELTRGFVALVDDDFEWAHLNWYATSPPKGALVYAVRNTPRDVTGKKTILLMHRVISRVSHAVQVDHWDHNGLNNQRANLRVCSGSDNLGNCRKTSGLSSRFKGVSWEKRRARWQVSIMHNYKRTSLGHYTSEIEAALAYDRAALSLFGSFACTNEAMGLFASDPGEHVATLAGTT